MCTINDSKSRLGARIKGVNVRRIVIIKIHVNRDSIKLAKLGHPSLRALATQSGDYAMPNSRAAALAIRAPLIRRINNSPSI